MNPDTASEPRGHRTYGAGCKRSGSRPRRWQTTRADADRLADALKILLKTDHVAMDLSLVRHLPHRLRSMGLPGPVHAFQRPGPVGAGGRVRCRQRTGTAAGLAVDLGTSRVVVRLVDLSDGRTLGETAFDNPQIAVGPDILTRIHAADAGRRAGAPQPAHHRRAQWADPRPLPRPAAWLAADIHLVSLAGNTAMTHLFLGLDPHWMIREPYIPAVNRPGLLRASQLGLAVNPGARVLVFPNIGSYFGGDLIAGILFSGLDRSDRTAMLVDVGTNAEVVVGNSNWLIACAGAAGPALEGGVTRMGMMAGPGVIDGVTIDPATGGLDLHVIGDRPPLGICGSGLIDLAAQLFLTGRVDIRGKFVAGACGSRLRAENGMNVFQVASADRTATGRDLTVSEADLDSLVRSKAAMFTILETITETVGVCLDTLDVFYVAGTFGSFIKPASAIAIGMLPDLPTDRYRPLGNSSLGGAAMALTDPGTVAAIDRIRDRITYMELNVNQEFMNRFSAARFLPHTDRARFPSVTLSGG